MHNLGIEDTAAMARSAQHLRAQDCAQKDTAVVLFLIEGSTHFDSLDWSICGKVLHIITDLLLVLYSGWLKHGHVG